ncbi:hypothetical protein CRYUN_Cryun22dG0083500 [Craigia yunnanensis]
MSSHASTTGENGVSDEPGMVQEAHLENVSQVTQPCQPMEDIAERREQRLEENIAPKPDDNAKIGMRTRSHLKA